MEYNGLAYAWSGQTFARHWGMRLSLALMQATHKYGMGRVSEYTLLSGRRVASGWVVAGASVRVGVSQISASIHQSLLSQAYH